MTTKMKGKHVNLSLVQCYAPTNDSDDSTKDNFYDQLRADLETLTRQDMLVIKGLGQDTETTNWFGKSIAAARGKLKLTSKKRKSQSLWSPGRTGTIHQKNLPWNPRSPWIRLHLDRGGCPQASKSLKCKYTSKRHWNLSQASQEEYKTNYCKVSKS